MKCLSYQVKIIITVGYGADVRLSEYRSSVLWMEFFVVIVWLRHFYSFIKLNQMKIERRKVNVHEQKIAGGAESNSYCRENLLFLCIWKENGKKGKRKKTRRWMVISFVQRRYYQG